MSKKNSKIHVFTDFDGTITLHDSLEAILDHFTGKDWRKIEEQVTLGRLSEKTSLQAEFSLMNAEIEDVLDFVDKEVHIDSSFKDFVTFCQTNEIQLTILSGGIDVIIDRILRKFDLQSLTYFCNALEISDKANWKIIPSALPKIKNNCNHCKTNHLIKARELGRKVVYIGDGNTDRCPAENADIIFAKDSLKEYLEENRIKYFSFNDFKEVKKKLEELCFN